MNDEPINLLALIISLSLIIYTSSRMNLYTYMPKSLKPYFLKELSDFKTAMQHNDLQTAWRHLERAHVIGQAYPFEHSYVHWKMLLFGIRIKDGKEIIG